MEEGGRLCEGLEYGTEQAAEEEEEVRAAGLLAKLERDLSEQDGPLCTLPPPPASPGSFSPHTLKQRPPGSSKSSLSLSVKSPLGFHSSFALRCCLPVSQAGREPGVWGRVIGLVPGKAGQEAALQPSYLVLAGQSRSGKPKRLFRATWAKYPSSLRNVEADSMERTLELHIPRWHETHVPSAGRLSCARSIAVHSQSTLGSEEQPRTLALGWEHTSSATRSPHWMSRSSTS